MGFRPYLEKVLSQSCRRFRAAASMSGWATMADTTAAPSIPSPANCGMVAALTPPMMTMGRATAARMAR